MAALSQSYGLILDFFAIIGSSNLFPEQCHGPDSRRRLQHHPMVKGLVEVSEHLSPFHNSFPAPQRSNNCHHFCSPHPTPSNHGPGKVRRRWLWTISHHPRLHMPALQEALQNHPPQTPSRAAPLVPPFFMPPLPSQPPFPLPSTAPPSLGLTTHPLLSGYGPPIPSPQQQPLPPTLPISPANSSLDAHPNP